MAAGILSRREDAEDVTSEFFIRLWNSAHKYRRGRGHRAWLITIAHNMTIDYQRKHSRELAVDAAEAKPTESSAQETIGTIVSETQTRHPEESRGVIVLAAGALAVPENAVTVPADAQYFSEDILRESNLLCGAEVTGVSFAYDDSGKASKVIYDITVDSVYYAEDYLAQAETMQVSSPIIESEEDAAYVLYQMRVGGTYLVPLKAADGGFELLYPFAPQIQQVEERQFLFHTGYSSLINDRTMVVEGHQEGSNDFYYDRMLMRSDEAFLSDLISIFK